MIRSILSIILTASCAHIIAATPGVPREVAVVVHSEGKMSPEAWKAMETESARIARQAGLRVRFLERSEAAGAHFDDLVVFKMRGKCEMDSYPAMLDERGPFAWAFTADGNVLPFGEVKCDRVRESVKTVLRPSDFAQGDHFLGRALGRVVAHEIYHMMANTKKHGKSGVTKDALSARQLVDERLDLSDHSAAAMTGTRDFR